jgi:hypothetical protein
MNSLNMHPYSERKLERVLEGDKDRHCLDLPVGQRDGQVHQRIEGGGDLSESVKHVDKSTLQTLPQSGQTRVDLTWE